MTTSTTRKTERKKTARPGPARPGAPQEPDEDGLTDDDLPPEDEAEEKPKADGEWLAGLRRKPSGEVIACSDNARKICCNHPLLRKAISWDQFRLEPRCRKRIATKKINTGSDPVPKPQRKLGRLWGDADDAAVKFLCSAKRDEGGFEVDFGKEDIISAVTAAGKQNPVHPVKDFLKECHAEYLRRAPANSIIDRLAADYCGCPDTAYHRETSRLLLLQAVARIYEPGCKVDTVVILKGPTGSRKSSFWRVLFNGMIQELVADLDDTGRVIENLRGNWAVEMAEMERAKKADANTLKSLLSSSSDQYRLAYGRREQVFPRQSLFVATTNENDFLGDPTSQRRYWVWESPKCEGDPIDTDRLQADLWHLWGEAVQTYLDLRAEQPHGDLYLDLQDSALQVERDRIAHGNRRMTVGEMIADVVAEWLEQERPANEVMLDKDGMVLDEHAEDETPMIRVRVSADEAFAACRHHEALIGFHSSEARTYAQAMRSIPGWEHEGRCRRLGRKGTWFVRAGFQSFDGRWAPAPEEDLLA